MKFKVINIKNLAQHGINFSILTDEETDSVLKTVFYTSNDVFYSSTTNTEGQKIAQMVGYLLEPFSGTCRTIYTNRFYELIYTY